MTRDLYDRQCQVSIGPAGQQGRAWRGGNEGLRITFEVKKYPSKSQNTAKIEIYNLSDDSVGYITEEMSTVLTAGYQQTEQGIFFGDVTHIERAGEQEASTAEDVATTIEAGDGIDALRGATIHKTFGPGTSAEQIAESLKSELDISGVSRGFTEALADIEGLRNGYTASGSVRTQLDALFAGTQYSYSIQDDQLEITGESGLAETGVIVLRKDTGLLEAKEVEDGQIKAKSLLMGKIKPNRRLKVESDKIQGVYRTREVTHKGDTHGQDWYTEVICE